MSFRGNIVLSRDPVSRVPQNFWIIPPKIIPDQIFVEYRNHGPLFFHNLTRSRVYFVRDEFFSTAEEDRTFFGDFGQVVVIDTEFCEHDLVLVFGQRPSEPLLGIFFGKTPFFDQGPETSVILIVNVGVHLAPREVIPYHLVGRVEDGAPVESRWSL